MQVQRFVFESFKSREAAAPAAEEPVVAIPIAPKEPTIPMITVAEAEAMKQQAYINGVRDGETQAEQRINNEAVQLEQAIEKLLGDVKVQLEQVSETERMILAEKREEISRLALNIAKKVAGQAIKQDPLAGVEQIVAECLSMLTDETKVIIFVHPSNQTALQKRLTQINPDNKLFTGELTVQSDDALAREDCRLEWKNGMAERKTAELWTKIEALVQQTHIGGGNTSLYIANK